MEKPGGEYIRMFSMITTNDSIGSGLKDIAEAIGGGIKEKSLMFIEGESRSGKSVVCQHIAYAVLERGASVAFYSSEHHEEGLLARMSSMSLDARKHLLDDRLKVFKIYSKNIIREPQKSLELIIRHIQGLPHAFSS